MYYLHFDIVSLKTAPWKQIFRKPFVLPKLERSSGYALPAYTWLLASLTTPRPCRWSQFLSVCRMHVFCLRIMPSFAFKKVSARQVHQWMGVMLSVQRSRLLILLGVSWNYLLTDSKTDIVISPPNYCYRILFTINHYSYRERKNKLYSH